MPTNSKEKYIINICKSPQDDRDYCYENNDKFPIIFDMRKQLNKVRNQGEQGSCAAFSAACIKEYQEYKDYNFKGYMSPQFFYDNRSNLYDKNPNNDYGMYGRDIMKLLKNIGICKEEDYVYGDIKNKKDIPPEIYKLAKNHTIKSYARVNNLQSLKNSLVKNGPCLICFPVYNTGKHMWYKENDNDEMMGGHAMTVVGYNMDSFIIRNSWGESWGDKGYCYYPFKHWGMHWELWTTVDNKSNPTNNSDKTILPDEPNIRDEKHIPNKAKKNSKIKIISILGLITFIIVCIIMI